MQDKIKMETKKCRRCKKIKSIKEFTTDKKAKGGRIGRCGACIWKQIKDRSLGIKKEPKHPGKLQSKEYNWSAMMLSNYGITHKEYYKILIEQNESCYICKRHESEFDRKLAVDHCHTTNIIRGLLCGDCNKALGLFRDNIRSLTIAIEYLQKYRQ